MKSAMTRIVVLTCLFAISQSPANGALISVGDASNVAPLATASSADLQPNGAPISAVTNGVVSDGMGGSNPFQWSETIAFVKTDPAYTIDLTWTTGQNLGSLQAYVNSPGVLGADCTTSSIEFFVKQGTGSLTSVGSANVPSTANIGYYTLTELDGNWSNVTAVRYQFTLYSAASVYGPRVAEVLANTSAPEPSAFVVMLTGLITLLAYAWRKRRCVPS